MQVFFRKYAHYLHFLPAVVILLFGMLALHISVRLSDSYHLYEALHAQETAAVRTSLAMEENIENLHFGMYWSVIAISLSGFLLFVLSAYRLTQMERLGDELKNSLRQLEYRSAAVEASFEGIGIVDHNGNLIYMNKALMGLHGITPEESGLYIGQPWANLYTPKGREQIEKYVLPALEEKGYWRGISPIVRQGGQVLRADLSLTRLEDGGLIGTARDMTFEDRAEIEKREMMDQLYQAQKMEAVGRLAGGIAHDFNNILAAMNGYAEFLVEDLAEGTPQQGFAKNILLAGRQARALVDKILAFSRRKESESGFVDLRVPLEESLSMLRASMPKTVDLVTKIDMDKAPVSGSSTQIAQVLMNLCVNASDAMEDKRGRLSVSLEKIFSTDDAPLDWLSGKLPGPQEQPAIRIDDIAPGHTRLLLGHLARDHDYARIAVEDTGTGMGRAVMEHIFEPFFTTKPVDKGTGLGLSTVHGVMAAHGGAMMINSRLGKGTRFDLYFPLAEGQAVEAQAAQAKPGSVIVGKILLVEDQPEVREMTLTMLSRLGYEADIAVNGMDALDVLREKGGYYDLVLTDHNMPKMTGIELAQQAHIDFPGLPFVLLSGYAQEKLQELMTQNPSISMVLRKPIGQADLGAALSSIMAQVRVQ